MSEDRTSGEWVSHTRLLAQCSHTRLLAGQCFPTQQRVCELLAEHCSHTRLLAQARQCFPHTRLSARCNVFPTLDTASPTPNIASLHPATSPYAGHCFLTHFSTHPALVLHTPGCSPSNASPTHSQLSPSNAWSLCPCEPICHLLQHCHA